METSEKKIATSIHIEDHTQVTVPVSELAAAFEDAQRQQSWRTELTSNPRPLLWCCYMLFTVIMWGYDGLAGGIVISMTQFREDYGYLYEGQWVVSAKWQLAFTAASVIGLLIGGPPATLIAKRWGRRPCLWLGYTLSVTGVFLQWFSKGNLPMFFGSKLVTGLPLGMFITITPTYCAEIAPLALRGAATGAVNWCIVLGQVIGYGVLRQTQTLPGSRAYRTLFAVQWGFAAVGICFLAFLPESPYFWVTKGNLDRARHTAIRIRGKNADIDGWLASIQNNVESEGNAPEASFAMCLNRKNLKRSMIAVSGFFIQQNCGTTWVLGYMAYFLQLGGMSAGDAFNTTFGLTGVMLVGNMFGWWFIERVGRRPTAVYGCFALAATLVFIGVTAVIPSKGAIWAQVAFMAIWSFTYQATIGSVAWALATEVPASALRQHTQALATVVQGLVGTTWSFVMPYLVNPDEADLNGKVGFIFGGILAVSSIWLFFNIPETKGRSFQEIDALFEAGISPRKFKVVDLNVMRDEKAA